MTLPWRWAALERMPQDRAEHGARLVALHVAWPTTLNQTPQNPENPSHAQGMIVTGEEYAAYIEMGGRDARDALRMRLPSFGVPPPKPVRRTESLLDEARCRTSWEWCKQCPWPQPRCLFAWSPRLHASRAVGRTSSLPTNGWGRLPW